MPLREATLADVEAMHAVRMSVRENVLSDPSRVQPQHYREMLEQRGKGWVFEDGVTLLGFGIADHRTRNIWALFVAPGFEQRGVGRALLDEMVHWLFTQSEEPIWLMTQTQSRAYRFYQAAGWREIGDAFNGESRFELSR